MRKLSAKEAREISLAALGFRAGLSSLDDAIGNLGLFQLDTVNVFERAHLMPAFSRIGPYPKDSFQSWAFGPKGERKLE